MGIRRGRPERFPIKKLIALDERIVDALEAFRAGFEPAINQSEAFRDVLTQFLTERGYLKES
jgi:hypothetical protein